MSTEAALPPIVDYDSWSRSRAELLPREKAHTREGDAIAAARRRLPMTELEADTSLVGESGPITLLDLFDGRDQLLIYKHMWHPGKPNSEQCEGCTASIWDVKDAVYLNRRGVSMAVVCEGAWAEIAPYREFMGYTLPWYSAHGLDHPVLGRDFGEILALVRDGDRVFLTYTTTARGVEVTMTSAHLLDLTVYGRQEQWEDSPQGWPQTPGYWGWIQDGRPTPQWTRPGVSGATSASEGETS